MSNERPKNLIPDDYPRHFEIMASEVIRLIPLSTVTRTRDAIQIDIEDPRYERIVLLLTPDAIELRFEYTDWVHPGSPARSSRLWRRLELPEQQSPDWLHLLQEASDAVRASHLQCEDCGKTFPPEHTLNLDGRTVCHGCAQGHHGVVF